MDKQREDFEKFKAKQMNISYEKLKHQLDDFERKTNDRYGVVGFDNDWSIWQQAQKVAVHEGFVLIDKSKTEHWYLDEGENMWMEEPDYWLCDMDIGEVQAVEYKEHLVTKSNTLYATKVWDDENGGVDTWEFFKSQDEAEKASAHCKARFWEEEAQEQAQ